MKESIQRISIIGHGNVGSHLAIQLHNSGIIVSHILTRNSQTAKDFSNSIGAESITNTSELPKNQLVLLCVPDDTVSDLLFSIDESCPVAYTSGAVELQSLTSRENIGVFYPLQTFTKGGEMNLADIPFFIEGNNEYFAQQLFDLASKLSTTVNFATSEERKKLHVTAVWVNNFTNHMLHNAQEYATKNGVDFNHLMPLLKETIAKLDVTSALENQTGPARRGDQATMGIHKAQLEGLQKELYVLISKSIQQTYLK